jgi:hypothetical protein
MADSLRDHIANLVAFEMVDNGAHDEKSIAEAILTQPEIAAIIDLAAWLVDDVERYPSDYGPFYSPPEWTPAVRGLLADWRNGPT